MPILHNIRVLATCKEMGGQSDIHPIKDAAIAWEADEIKWVGSESDLPEQFRREIMYNAGGNLVIPGLIDCHTHLAFGGWRAEEFEKRIEGNSYFEIAREGGGILSTVRATRRASEEELFDKSYDFLEKIAQLGISAIECKSGYGLTTEQELKILRVYDRLRSLQPFGIEIVPTFMGAHVIPPEYENDREKYVDLIINEMIPEVAQQELAEFCDIFIEESAFTVSEAERILTAAKASWLAVKVHADQLTSCGGAELAAEMEAISADHLEKASDEGIKMMADSGVVAVSLPIASLYTQVKPLDCRNLVDRGVPVGVATDFNPGSAPSYDLILAMMLSCTLGGLTPAGALKGATIYAAKAIGRDYKLGSIEPGKKASFVIIDAPDPKFWMYHYRPDTILEKF